MKKIANIKGVIISMLVFASIVAFTEINHEKVEAKALIINFNNQADNFFLDQLDVERIIEDQEVLVEGGTISRPELNELENKLTNERFVKEAELFADLKGNLVANVTLRRPMARMIRSNAPDAYIAEDGHVLPTSSKYTARVMLISGGYSKLLLESKEDLKTFNPTLYALLDFIHHDDFWRAQVAQLHISGKGEIEIYPQVTKQKIVFGTAEDFRDKLKKVRIFYDKILPRSWNKYVEINVAFKGQVVAK